MDPSLDFRPRPGLRRIPTLHVADIELPRDLEGLYELAYNLWWSWSPEARELFSRIDAARWAHYRNPVELLINIEPRQWLPLLESDTFRDRYRRVHDAFHGYLSGVGEAWYARAHGDGRGGPIAYFSMEYGLHSCLAIYSGGLGVLSGDHLKSASDLGVPLVAVGLLYRHGYFQQSIDADGVQQHIYPEYDFTRLPLRPVATATGREVWVTVPLPGRDVRVKVWLCEVGRVPLVLLDTDVPENDAADRPISNLLYVRGREMRLVQEIVLGVGGVRALDALGIEPSVWHLNEGHSVFLQLERLRRRVENGGGDLDALRRELRQGAVFTTHTPVAAGNEQFDAALIGKYFAGWCEQVGIELEALLDWGRARAGEEGFNLTALAIRTSRLTNGVSELNATVVGEMWRHLFAEPRASGEGDAEASPEDRDSEGEAAAAEAAAGVTPARPISAITNGVHTASWIGGQLRALFAEHLGSDWESMLLGPAGWERVRAIPDVALWEAHRAQKERLGRFLRGRVRDQHARHGASPDELRAVGALFDPEALTLGFARRFATYKRANLIFSDRARLETLLGDDARPVQLVFAGKAHPADRPGQELIQKIFQLSRSEELAGRVFFLENYDMRMGAILVQGVDVWLNTPRRPLEASGTSGQKAALNGALNFSVLDGWWPEGYDGENGWVIGGEKTSAGEAEQDEADVASFHRTMAEEILPLYFDRDGNGLPRGWIARMKASIASLTWRFSANRMVRDYVEKAYLQG